MKPISKRPMRLGVPAVSALEKHFRPMVVTQIEFREPHAFAERQKNAPFDRAGFPTDTPAWAVSPAPRLAPATTTSIRPLRS